MGASAVKTDPLVSGDGALVVPEHLEPHLSTKVTLERLGDYQPRRLSAIALAPAILFADHNAEQRGRPGYADEVGQRGRADQPVRRLLVDRVAGAVSGHGQNDRVEIASGLDVVQWALVVAQKSSDFLIGIPTLKCGPIVGNVLAKANGIAGANEPSRRQWRTTLELAVRDLAFMSIDGSPPQPGKAALGIGHITSLQEDTATEYSTRLST